MIQMALYSVRRRRRCLDLVMSLATQMASSGYRILVSSSVYQTSGTWFAGGRRRLRLRARTTPAATSPSDGLPVPSADCRVTLVHTKTVCTYLGIPLLFVIRARKLL